MWCWYGANGRSRLARLRCIDDALNDNPITTAFLFVISSPASARAGHRARSSCELSTPKKARVLVLLGPPRHRGQQQRVAVAVAREDGREPRPPARDMPRLQHGKEARRLGRACAIFSSIRDAQPGGDRSVDLLPPSPPVDVRSDAQRLVGNVLCATTPRDHATRWKLS